MEINIHLIILLCFFFGCKNTNDSIRGTQEPSHWVGDIHFDSKMDDPNFILCDSTNIIHRRNGLSYPGGKEAVKKECFNKFQFQPEFKSFSGFVMVRFIVNCEQELGRFRVQPLDFDFFLKECPLELQEHILSIVKELKDWEQAPDRDKAADCSKYLNFKIKNGQLENVLQ